MPMQPFYTDKNTAKAILNAAKNYAVPQTTDNTAGIKPAAVNTQYQNTCKFKLTSDWQQDGNVFSAYAKKFVYIEGQYVVRDLPNDADFVIYTESTSRPAKGEIITATRRANRWELVSGGGGASAPDDSIYVQVEPKAKGAACEFRNEQPLYGIKVKKDNELLDTWDLPKYSENRRYQRKTQQFTFDEGIQNVSLTVDLWGWNKTTEENTDGIPKRHVYLGYRGVRVRIAGLLVDPDDIQCSQTSIEPALQELATEEWLELYDYWHDEVLPQRQGLYSADNAELSELKAAMTTANANVVIAQKTGGDVSSAQAAYTAAQSAYNTQNTLVKAEKTLYDAAVEKCRKFKTKSYSANDLSIPENTTDWELYDDKEEVDETLTEDEETLTELKEELTALRSELTPLQTALTSVLNSSTSTESDIPSAVSAVNAKEPEVSLKEYEVLVKQNAVDDGKSYQKAIDDHLAELEAGFMRVLSCDGKPKKHGVNPVIDTVTFTFPRKIMLDETDIDTETHKPKEREDAEATVEFFVRPHHDWYILSAGGLTEVTNAEGIKEIVALPYVYSFDLNKFEWNATRFPKMPVAQYNFDMAVFPYMADSSIEGGQKEKVYRLIAMGGFDNEGDYIQYMFYTDLNAAEKWHTANFGGGSDADVIACAFAGRPMFPFSTDFNSTSYTPNPSFATQGGIENGEHNGIGYNEHVVVIGGGEASYPYKCSNGERFSSPAVSIIGPLMWATSQTIIESGHAKGSCCFVFNVKNMKFVNQFNKVDLSISTSEFYRQPMYHRSQNFMACGIKHFCWGDSTEYNATRWLSLGYRSVLLIGGFHVTTPDSLTEYANSDTKQMMPKALVNVNFKNSGIKLESQWIQWLWSTGMEGIAPDSIENNSASRVTGDGALVFDAKGQRVYFFGGRTSENSKIPAKDVLWTDHTDWFGAYLPSMSIVDGQMNPDPYPTDPLKMPKPRYSLEAALIRDHLKPEAGILNGDFDGSEEEPQLRAFTLFGYEEGNVFSNAMNVFNITEPNGEFWEI